MTKDKLSDVLLKVGGLIIVLYFVIGFILNFYFDYERISEYGFWNWFWYGRDAYSAAYEIIFWPFYL
jgi:hypothetical protein